jgi:hypothetical protein
LESLPSPLPINLETLELEGTKVTCLPLLPKSLKYLHSTNVSCVPNIPRFLWDVYMKIGSTYIGNVSQIPMCNITSVCQYPAYISGKVFYDLNNNGIQNANEPNTKQIMLKSTDGSLITLTDTTGKYFLIGDYSKTYA